MRTVKTTYHHHRIFLKINFLKSCLPVKPCFYCFEIQKIATKSKLEIQIIIIQTQTLATSFFHSVVLTLYHNKMFEAKILQGSVLKKIIEAIRELVNDANLDCNERGITMQVN